MNSKFSSISSLIFLCFIATVSMLGSSWADDSSNNGTVENNLLYITNRNPIVSENGSIAYGEERHHSLGFGAVHVYGNDASGYNIGETSEIGRFPNTPYTLEKHGDYYTRSSSIMVKHIKAAKAFREELSRRVSSSKSKEVIIFIHGFNNTFDDAIKSSAHVCNDFEKNDFVCVVFTWPAGGFRGAFMGYNYDRESGEFSVPDLRKSIRMIADTLGVRKIHLIAHSRGTDVLSSAFIQLGMEAYGQKSYTAKRFKIENIVLAAPDIDIDVAYSRIRGVTSDPELPFGGKANYQAAFYPEKIQLTVYASEKDMALDAAKGMFGSEARLGQVSADDHGMAEMLAHRSDGAAEFISVNDQADLIGHNYFLSNNFVCKDIVAIIKEHIKVGDNRRSLTKLSEHHWQLIQ